MVDIAPLSATSTFSNQRQLAETLERIASGSRLNDAADGAAQLAIATVLSAEDTVLSQAATNVSQGASVAQVADGGLARIADSLTRLKELAAAAGNGALDTTAREAIDSEAQQIFQEISDIASSTTFNGQSLLDEETTLSFQAGAEAGERIDLDTRDVTLDALGLSGLSLEDPAALESAIQSIDTAIDRVAETRAEVGGTLERFESRFESINSQQEQVAAARSALADTDLAAALTAQVAEGIIFEGNAFAIAQSNRAAQQILAVLQ